MKRLYAYCETFAVDVPEAVLCSPDEQSLKDWFWQNHQQRLFQSLRLAATAPPIASSSAIEDQRDEAIRSEEDPSQRRRRGSSSRGPLVREEEDLADAVDGEGKSFLCEELRLVYSSLLETILELTHSEYGFIGDIQQEKDGTPYLQTRAYTNIAWDEGSRKLLDSNPSGGVRFYNMDNLIGAVIKTQKPVISNQPHRDSRSKGVPKGHPPLRHFLGIPFFDKEGDFLGVVGVANKEGGYTEDDVKCLEPVTWTCSNLLTTSLHFVQSEQFIALLERKVEERTQELQALNERLHVANRRQLKYFASLSHEIRTPLNCILGISNLLLETAHGSQQKESVQMILKSGERLLNVVNDVIDFSKLDNGNLDLGIQPMNVPNFLEDLFRSVEPKAQAKGISIRSCIDCTLPEFIHTDHRSLRQILYNLLDNAIKFSSNHKTIELSMILACQTLHRETPGASSDTQEVSLPATTTSERDPEIQPEQCGNSTRASGCPFFRPASKICFNTGSTCPLSSAESCSTPEESSVNTAELSDESSVITTSRLDSGRTSNLASEAKKVLRVTVKDYGIGIKKEYVEKLFEPFFVSSGDSRPLDQGTGLGLAITSKLVGALGGTISVDSREGAHTAFIIELPFCDTTVDVTPLSSALKDCAVILIDPERHPPLRASLTCILNTYQVDFTVCGSPEEVAERIHSSPRERRKKALICLFEQSLYPPDVFQSLKRLVPTAAIVTFGDTTSTDKGLADLHLGPLHHIVPSVLMTELGKCLAGKLHATNLPTDSLEGVAVEPVLRWESLRVLVAEDHIVNQKVIVRMLNRLGVRDVDVVENGQQAVDREAERCYDVVLMDLHMPIMDGIQACQLIMGRQGDRHPPPVFFVTAHASTEYEHQCREAGAKAFLTKPVNLASLKACVETFGVTAG